MARPIPPRRTAITTLSEDVVGNIKREALSRFPEISTRQNFGGERFIMQLQRDSFVEGGKYVISSQVRINDNEKTALNEKIKLLEEKNLELKNRIPTFFKWFEDEMVTFKDGTWWRFKEGVQTPHTLYELYQEFEKNNTND